ncbi:hypothetical protein HK096_005595 [Nowakowskiella sp. JEL0078]|nr:hypothetical protein HK096_005595 [Nowakowskiella sp. JEL0078]
MSTMEVFKPFLSLPGPSFPSFNFNRSASHNVFTILNSPIFLFDRPVDSFADSFTHETKTAFSVWDCVRWFYFEFIFFLEFNNVRCISTEDYICRYNVRGKRVIELV